MLFPTRARDAGEDLTIEPEVGVVLDHDIAVLAAEDRVASDEHAVADEDPAIVGPLGVEAAIVDDDVVADHDLVRVAHHHVHAEHDVAPDASEDQRIQFRAQEQPQAQVQLASNMTSS